MIEPNIVTISSNLNFQNSKLKNDWEIPKQVGFFLRKKINCLKGVEFFWDKK